ncbi:flavin reductase family protein [Silicimonas sp. MF1-12-2]|uniref:flavin reductase family protein n=1 Tax=Silicimonas sp. MF1-12-2 TaxID=3384793 RepID=UPI0039B66D80
MATSFTPGPDTVRAFRDALGRFATGVTVVTCQSDLGPLGITANSFASLSLDPPLVLWSPARASRRFEAFANADHYAIHILSDAQQDLCRRFATQGHDFGGLAWTANDDGVPLFEGCLARFECTRHAIYEGGDHAIIVGHVTSAATNDGQPLLFAGGRYGGFEDRA